MNLIFRDKFKVLSGLRQFYIIVILSSCANRIAPSGGEKDVQMPKIVSSSPENFSTSFNQKEIRIDFDEYIQLIDLNKQLIISPIIDPAPEISAIKKSLKIKFEKPLSENTTYTFNFGSAIADVHENNIYENFQFVFSTGDYLDSLSVSGKVENAENLKTEKGTLVMLYKNMEDSVPYKKLPDYFAKTDDAGNYKIGNIGNGAFKIFALKDKNNNYLFDHPDEEIAFLSSPVEISDSSKADLKLFKNPPDKIQLKSSIIEEQGKLKIIFNSRAEEIKLKTIDVEKNPWMLEEFTPNKDTLTLWITDTILDALKIVFLKNEQPFDTTIFVLKKKVTGKGTKAKTFSFTADTYGTDINAEQKLKIVFTHPVKVMDESKIIFKIDSIPATGINFSFPDSVKRNLVGKFDWQENKSYELLFLPGAVKDIFNSENDTVKISFKLKLVTEFGSVLLKLKTGSNNTSYIVQLVNDKDEVIREKVISSSAPDIAELSFDLLNPASYRFKVIYDENMNNRWDAGNYLKKLQPEMVIYHKEPVGIRANWDLEAEWSLENK